MFWGNWREALFQAAKWDHAVWIEFILFQWPAARNLSASKSSFPRLSARRKSWTLDVRWMGRVLTNCFNISSVSVCIQSVESNCFPHKCMHNLRHSPILNKTTRIHLQRHNSHCLSLRIFCSSQLGVPCSWIFDDQCTLHESLPHHTHTLYDFQLESEPFTLSN